MDFTAIIPDFNIVSPRRTPAVRGYWFSESQEDLDAREDRLRAGNFVHLHKRGEQPRDLEHSPYPKPWAWEALKAAEVAEAATHEAEDWISDLETAVGCAIADEKGVDRSRADWYTPKIEIDLNGPYGMRMVWIKSDRGLKVRTSADNLTLSEAVRLTGYIQERLAGWEREVLGSFPADALGLAVPYDAALGEKATHILLYADGECIGHLPATGSYEERLAEAQRVYREIEASWAMVTPKYPRSPWSADSAESPWTPDTPESAE